MNTIKRWFVFTLLFGILGLALAACGGTDTAANSAASQAIDGPIAIDFTVSTGPLSSFSMSEHRGDIVVLYFSFPG